MENPKTRAEDAAAILSRENKARDKRIENIEKQMNNLQETWNRILNIKDEKLTPKQPKQKPILYDPDDGHYPGDEPAQNLEQTAQHAFAPWDELPIPEDSANIKTMTKTKTSNKKKIIISLAGILILLMIIAFGIMSRAGYSCVLPH